MPQNQRQISSDEIPLLRHLIKHVEVLTLPFDHIQRFGGIGGKGLFQVAFHHGLRLPGVVELYAQPVGALHRPLDLVRILPSVEPPAGLRRRLLNIGLTAGAVRTDVRAWVLSAPAVLAHHGVGPGGAGLGLEGLLLKGGGHLRRHHPPQVVGHGQLHHLPVPGLEPDRPAAVLGPGCGQGLGGAVGAVRGGGGHAAGEQEDHQQHVNLEWGETPPIVDKRQDRSLQIGMEVFLDEPNLVFCSNMAEEQEAGIYILNASGEKVMSETLLLSPYSETSLYIGDLPNGTYQLVIELEDAALYGTFLIL